ncbi:hypothetical protein [Pelagibius sp.]|uniref:hypothetical protein n=1 Tax=Pelagibius sp. TaxID=1931238 RepID=UPI003BAE8AC0
MFRRRSRGDQHPAKHLSTRRRHGSAWRRALLSATAFSAVFAASGAAFADYGNASVTNFSAPPVVVENNGSTYTGLSSPAVPIRGDLEIEVDAEISGRVTEWFARPEMTLPNGNTMLFPNSGVSDSYDTRRPKRVERTHRFTIEKTDYAATMAVACNQNAQRLQSQGWSQDQVFAQDHQVQVFVDGYVTYETTGIEGVEEPPEVGSRRNAVNVTCRREAPVREIPSVVSRLNILEEASNTGACTLGLQVEFETASPNQLVRFRFVDDTGQQSNILNSRTRDDGTASFTQDYQLTGGGRSGQIRIVGVDANFASPWREYDLICGQGNGGLTTVLPPKADSVSYQVESETEFRGLYCPEVITVAGVARGRGESSGRALLSVGNRPLQMFEYTFDDTERDIFKATHTLSWDNVQQARQPLRIAMQLRNNGGDLVDETAQDFSVVCRAPSMPVGQGIGGIGVEPREEHSQQGIGGRLAQPGGGANAQLAGVGEAATAGFDIQAPEGRVRKGVIRLSGGQANANYALRFFRRTDGGLQRVRSAQLPQQMTGNTANFDLRPLAGSRAWRLEVCQIGSTGISSTANCETSDFSLGRLGGVQSGAEPSAEPVKRPRRIMQRNAN